MCLLNPKAEVFFVTVFPQFLGPGDAPVRLALMLPAYEGIVLAWLSLYGYLVNRVGQSRVGTCASQAVRPCSA